MRYLEAALILMIGIAAAALMMVLVLLKTAEFVINTLRARDDISSRKTR